jgi:circadian clock protein KaiC
MTMRRNSTIQLLPSGVPGLDTVLGGGLPEYSFNLIAGGPGAGKSTLAQQIVFSRASAEAPAIYFTVLGEPPLKMLRHVQQYAFFDKEKLGGAVRFVNLSAEAMDHNLGPRSKRSTPQPSSSTRFARWHTRAGPRRSSRSSCSASRFI